MSSDVAKLRYSVDTSELVTARTELGKVKVAAEDAQKSLESVGGRKATDAFSAASTGATGTSKAIDSITGSSGKATDAIINSNTRASNSFSGVGDAAAKMTNTTGKAANDASTAMDTLTRKTGATEDAIDKIAGERDQFGKLIKSADSASDAVGDIGTETGKASDQVTKHTETMEKGFNKAKIAVAAVFAGAVGFVKSSLDTFRQMESMEASVKTVTGSAEAAGKAMETIKEFAKDTPFTLEQSVQGFIKLKSLGLDPSKDALLSYGNTASAMGKDMNQMVEAVADATTMEFERLKEFGIKSKQEGDNVTFTFQGVSTTVKKEAGAIQGYLMDIGNVQFAGAMADQMDTVNGALANAEDSFDNFKNTFIKTTGIDQAFKNLVVGVSGALGDLSEWMVTATESASEFWENLKTSDDTPYKLLRDIGGAISDLGGFLAPVLPAVGTLVATLGGSVGTWALAAGGVGMVVTAFTALKTVMKNNPYVLGITAIATAAYLIYDNWEPISKFFTDLWGDIKTGLTTFSNWWDDKWSKITEAGSHFTDWLGGGIVTAMNNFSSWWAGLTDFEFEITMPSFSGLVSDALNIHTKILSALVGAAKFIFDIGMPSFAEIKAKGVALVDDLKEWWDGVSLFEIEIELPTVDGFVSGASEKISGISGWLKDRMRGAGNDGGDGLVQGLDDSISDVEKATKDLAAAIPETVETDLDINSPSRVMRALGGWIGTGLADGIDSKIGAVTEAAEKLSDGIVSSIKNADSVRDVFSNLGDFMKDWLKDMVAKFAAQKIMAYVGVDQSGMGGVESLLSKLTGGGSASADVASSAGVAGGATSSGVGAASAGLSAMAMPLAIAAGLGDYLGKELGLNANLLERGGIVGAALFGGKKEQTASGFDAGYSGGSVSGQNVDTYEKAKSFFRGTKVTEHITELSSEVDTQLSEFFTGMSTTITTQAGLLGVSGADAILDDFAVATQRFEGENIEEDLQEWLSESTRSAYKMAFENLGPEVQSMIDGAIDLDTANVEDIAAVFGEIGASAALMMPALEAVGVELTASADQNVAYAARLTEGLGGASAAMATMDLYAREFVPAGDLVNVALKEARDDVGAFSMGVVMSSDSLRIMNDALGDQFDGLIDTREEMNLYIDQLESERDALEASGLMTDAQREKYDDLTVAAYSNLQAIVSVEDAAIAQTDAMQAVYDEQSRQITVLGSVRDVARDLNLNFNALTPSAVSSSNALVEMMGGLDAFNAANQNYYDTFYTLEEQQQISLANAAAEVHNFNSALGLSGDAAIDTTAEIRAHVESLDLNTEAGRAQHAQAMDIVNSMGLVTESGKSVQGIMDEMPENLVNNFNEMTDVTAATAEDIAQTTFDIANTQAEGMITVETILAEIPVIMRETFEAISADSSTTAELVKLSSQVASNDWSIASDAFGGINAINIQSLQDQSAATDVSTHAGLMARIQIMDQIESLQGLEYQTGMATGEIQGNINTLQNYIGTLDTSTVSGYAAANAASAQVTALQSLQANSGTATTGLNNVTSGIGSIGTASTTFAERFAAAASKINSTDFSQITTSFQNKLNSLPTAAEILKDYNPQLGSYEVGTNYVPQTGLYELHQGEIVIPPGLSEQIRGLGVANSSISSSASPNVNASVSISPVAQQSGNSMARVEALLEAANQKAERLSHEISELRRERASSSASTNGALNHIAGSSARQVSKLDEVKQETRLAARKTAKAS